MQKQHRFLIGIDPDCEKSGVAILKNGVLTLKNLSFFELFKDLEFYKEKEVEPFVRVECGFLNKSNWHSKTRYNSQLNTQIGQRTGANHEVAKKICEMLDFLKIEYQQVKPSTSKVDKEFFFKVTGVKKSNQEQRDAAMLIVGF